MKSPELSSNNSIFDTTGQESHEDVGDEEGSEKSHRPGAIASNPQEQLPFEEIAFAPVLQSIAQLSEFTKQHQKGDVLEGPFLHVIKEGSMEEPEDSEYSLNYGGSSDDVIDELFASEDRDENDNNIFCFHDDDDDDRDVNGDVNGGHDCNNNDEQRQQQLHHSNHHEYQDHCLPPQNPSDYSSQELKRHIIAPTENFSDERNPNACAKEHSFVYEGDEFYDALEEELKELSLDPFDVMVDDKVILLVSYHRNVDGYEGADEMEHAQGIKHEMEIKNEMGNNIADLSTTEMEMETPYYYYYDLCTGQSSWDPPEHLST
jgi:hypothetical protein